MSNSLVMEVAEYNQIQNDYLAWIDSRVKTGASVARMNAELASAHLLLDGPEPDIVDMLEKSYAGFLGPIDSKPADPERDLLAITFGMYTSRDCGFDETLVLYSRRTLQRIAWINAEDLRTNSPQLRHAVAEGKVVSGWHLRQFAVGRDDPERGKLIGSAWVASNCTSNWNGQSLRIDLLRGQALDNVLSAGVRAFYDAELRIRIEGSTITFTYTSSVIDGTAEFRAAISRYRVQDGHAIRETPLALSFGGFIDEWLTADDAEAARWSTREAALQHHALAARYGRRVLPGSMSILVRDLRRHGKSASHGLIRSRLPNF